LTGTITGDAYMTNFPVKKENQSVQQEKQKDLNLFKSWNPFNSLFNFRYAYRSITFYEDQAYLKAKEARFSNGKFESEEIEGTFGSEVYQNAVTEMSKAWLKMMSAYMQPMLSFHSFFPFDPKDKQIK
jgi:hypothetical protein